MRRLLPTVLLLTGCLFPTDDTGADPCVGTSTFTWQPRPWDGPSDYGAEPGELWPPGAYRVVIEAEGTLAADGSAWELRLEAPLTLE